MWVCMLATRCLLPVHYIVSYLKTFEEFDTVLGEDPETQNYVSSIMDFIQNTYRNRPTQ